MKVGEGAANSENPKIDYGIIILLFNCLPQSSRLVSESDLDDSEKSISSD